MHEVTVDDVIAAAREQLPNAIYVHVTNMPAQGLWRVRLIFDGELAAVSMFAPTLSALLAKAKESCPQ